jgi:exosome complex component RRP42
MKEYLTELAKDNLRIDGRNFLELRQPIKIELGVAKKAEGSALIQIGETKLLAGVKLEVGTPFPDTPDKGTLMVNMEATQLSHPDFESGPPPAKIIEIARTIDRGIRETKMIDLEKLCIVKGEKVWMVFIDLYPLNHAGNLIDAGALGALAALKNARIPELDKEGKQTGKLTSKKLPLTKEPLTLTFIKINDTVMVDPCFEEEDVMDARLAVSVSGKDRINALQKSGPGGFTEDEVLSIIDNTFKLRKVLEKALGEAK